jgi:hypothetical protein
MGEYWKPVNVTRKEFIHPHHMGCGLKWGEWTHPSSPVMELIRARWPAGDRVIAVSDYGGCMTLDGAYLTHEDDLPTYDDLYPEDYKGWVEVRSCADLKRPSARAEPLPPKVSIEDITEAFEKAEAEL